MERRDLSGQLLNNRYRVEGRIGKGAMGSVYRAEDVKLGRVVAVKVINEQVPNEMAARRRFDREAKAMARLEHPHCASVVDVGMHDEQPFVVMDFVSGQALDELVAAGPLPIARAVEITRQVLFGLAHAHEHGIIHRDIKPANIVLSQKSGLGDHVKILDFGLAKLNQETSNLTSGVVVGTPSYMAPEQIRGLLIDPRVDIYACGVLLFELLTGTKPFRSANNEPLEVCMMHLNNPVPRLADMVPGRDFGALEDVVTHALAKDREHRFSTAGAFANALAAALPAYRPSGDLMARSTPPLGATMPLAEVDLVQAGRSLGAFDAPARQRAELAPTTASPPHGMPIDTRAATHQQAGLAPTAAPARRSARTGWIVIGGLALLSAVIGAGVLATRDRATEASPSPSPSPSASARPSPLPSPPSPAPARASDSSDPIELPTPAAPPSKDEDPAGAVVTRVEELVASGRRDAAINLLVKARKTHPKDARLAYHAGLLFMNRMWWPDGLKNLRAAIQLDPSYKTDAKLIDTVLRGFNSTAHYDWTLANFLHDDIGQAAKPFFEDAAKHHKNPVVRKRAASELRRYR